MTTQLLQWLNPDVMGKIALVTFFLIFAGVVIYAWTRSPTQVEHWSRLPLDDGDAV